MRLVTGLGNPGPKYAGNRHNLGFMLVEHFAQLHGAPSFREKFHGRFARVSTAGEDLVLLEPDTYMNLSGRSVQAALQFFKLDLSDLVVAHDELDLAYGEVRIKQGGGTAGHKGLKSIAECCGGLGFARLRLGIGRPRSGPVEGYVLSDFSAVERTELPDVLKRASAALADLVEHGSAEAMNRHNRRP
ncbi:MAG: aminoacyl-tRNA hydrolase [Myxococcales bacterium]|nr:aminoacyl-tRNA hydrolase [Myxococcales bacterium]